MADAISRHTSTCREILQECILIPRLAESEWAESRLADLNLWARGIGALAAGNSSLEKRLQNRKDIRDAVLNLLHVLQQQLGLCIVYSKLDPKDDFQDVGGLERPSSPEPYIYTSNDDAEHDFYAWSDACYSSDSSQSGDSNTSELGYEEEPVPIRRAESNFERRILKAISSVHDTLRQLAELSILIRKFSLKSRHQHADRSFEPEAYKDLESHLYALLWIQQTHREKVLEFAEKETKDLRHPTKHDATTASLGIIQQRLVKANLKRYHRLICARKRKPAVLRLPNVPDPPTFDPGNDLRNDTRIKSIPDVEGNEQWAPAKSQGTGAASKIATEMPALADIQRREPSRALTRISAGSKLEYPPLPKPPLKTEKTFKLDQCCCKFCNQVLTNDYSSNYVLWRQHIKEDLHPYICIFDSCSTPDTLYLTSNEWLHHINTEHVRSRWVCSICSTQTAVHEFFSSLAFDAHCLSAHRDIVDSWQLLSLKESCQVSLPISISCCPLCSWSPDGAGTTIDKVQQQLFDHVAKGLHNFALRALPWECGSTEEENTIAATDDNSQIGRNSDADSANLSRQGTDDSEAKGASEYEKNVFNEAFDSEMDFAAEAGTAVSSSRLAMLQEQPNASTGNIAVWLGAMKSTEPSSQGQWPLPNPADDEISITSTQSSHYRSSKESEVKEVLAEKTENSKKVYLLAWTGYPQEKSTWELSQNINKDILQVWNQKKKRQEQNLEEPFDIARFEARLKRLAAEKADRHKRREAKRKLLGLTVSPSESNAQREDDGSESSLLALEQGQSFGPPLPTIAPSYDKDEDFNMFESAGINPEKERQNNGEISRFSPEIPRSQDGVQNMFEDIKDVEHHPWRFTPSLLDPNSFAFSSVANPPLGQSTSTPGGTKTPYHNQANDLHQPVIGMGMSQAKARSYFDPGEELPPGEHAWWQARKRSKRE